MVKMKHMNAYMIDWRDHYSTQGWFPKGSLPTPEGMLCKSIGFYIGEDERHYHLCMSTHEFSNGDIMSILKSDVVRIKRVFQ